MVQLMADTFWKRWLKYYLPKLVPHEKWLTPQNNIRVSDLVLMRDMNVLKSQWCKARVLQVFLSKDSYVRRLEVMKPDRSKFSRDIRSICILECDVF